MQNGKTYHVDFSKGALVPLENPGLPVGQIVSYEDRANRRKEFVVTGEELRALTHTQQQTVICLEDGHSAQVSMAGGKLCGHWTIEDRILTAAELIEALQTAEVNKKRIAAEQKAAEEILSRQRAEERAQWEKEFSYLQKADDNHAGGVFGAKNIRKELARAFPGIKFSVRSDYSSIDIGWELGPTTREVEAITGKYQNGHFNGMEDIYEYNHENQWPDVYGGARFVTENRSEGAAGNLVAAALCARRGLTPPADGRSWWNVQTDPDHNGGANLASDARQLIFRQSYPAGAVIVGIEETGETCGDDICRTVFALADGTKATVGTPAAAAAHFRAKFAEWSHESKAELRALAVKTGRGLQDLFTDYNAWQESQFQADHRSDRSPAAFAKLQPAANRPCIRIELPAKPGNGPGLRAGVTGGAQVSFNVEKNGVEIRFPAKPAAAVLDQLKANGWRWSRFNGCWYHRADALAKTMACTLAGISAEESARLFANQPEIREATRADEGLREIFDGTADCFQKSIARLANVAGVACLSVFALWREYSAQCASSDQSAILSEFIEWYAPKLGGDKAALRAALGGADVGKGNGLGLQCEVTPPTRAEVISEMTRNFVAQMGGAL